MTGLSEFVEYKEGSIPLIVSVPHGGILECNSLPERKQEFWELIKEQ